MASIECPLRVQVKLQMFFDLLYLWLFLPLVLAAVTAAYALLRWRDTRQELCDPQLGIKVVLHALMSIGVLLYVSGLMLVLGQLYVDMSGAAVTSSRSNQFDPGYVISPWGYFGGKSTVIKTGAALTVSGLLVAGIGLWMIRSRTNDRLFLATRRLFVAGRALVSGVVAIASLTEALVLALNYEGIHGPSIAETICRLLGALTMWTLSLGVHIGLLLEYMQRPLAPGLDYLCVACNADLRGLSVHSGTMVCPACRSTVGYRQQKRLKKFAAQDSEAPSG